VYEITLKGNFNLPIGDLGLEFSPARRVQTISDEDYAGSADLKRFLGKYLTAKEVKDGKPKNVPAAKTAPRKDVVELPVKQEVEVEPQRADGASKTAAGVEKVAPAVAEKQPDDAVVAADGASRKSANDREVAEETARVEALEEKQVEEKPPVKAEEPKPVEPKKPEPPKSTDKEDKKATTKGSKKPSKGAKPSGKAKK